MGAFLGDIRGRSVAVDCALLNSTHSKLIEYYSSYKSICQGFTISIPEYTQIFGASQLSFAVWDSRGRGKVDAIEMFAGLVVFSRMRYQQKIKFLFEMFDFNEEGVLYYQNLAFLLLSACNATYKLFALPKTLPASLVQVFLDDYFTHDSKIHLQHLLRWTAKNRTVLQYFQLIGYEVDVPPDDRRIDAYSHAQAQAYLEVNPRVFTGGVEREVRLDGKMMGSVQSLLQRRQVGEEEMLNLQLQWLYGMEVGQQSIRFVRVQRQKAGNQRLIYSVGRVVVVYFPKLNMQRYYKDHTQPVSVIEISHHNRLAASAEGGDYPSIHVWDLETRLNLVKFKRIHKYGIKLMRFFRNDKYLLTISESSKGGTVESPVVLLKLDTKQIVMSTFLRVEILGISIWLDTPEKDGVALLISTSTVTALAPSGRAFSLQRSDLKAQRKDFNDIKAFALHPRGFLITAHEGRELWRWDEKYNCSPIKYDTSNTREILEIGLIGEDLLLIMDERDIELLSLKIQQPAQAKRRRSLGLFDSKLYNIRLFSMQVVQNNKLLVVSEFGDIIKVSGIQSEEFRFQKYYQLFRMENVTDVFLPNPTSILLISARFLYVVDRYEKELKVLAKYESQIKLSDIHKESLVAVSLLEGRSSHLSIISLADYTIRESFKLSCLLEDVKITENYILGLSDNILFVFHRAHDKYLEKEPVVHRLGIGKNLSFARQTDQRSFLLVTEIKEVYRLVLNGSNQLDVQKVDKQQENAFQRLSLYYPEQNYKHPLVVCPSRRLVALGRKNGDIFLWESVGCALTNSSAYTAFSFHSARVSRLLLNDDQMYSVGGQDGLVAELVHRPYLQVPEQDDLFTQEEEKAVKKPLTKTQWKEGQQRKTVCFRELQGSTLRQGQVEVTGLTEPDNIEIKAMIQQILNPSDKMNYQSQITEDPSAERLVLQLQSVYGININSKNILYVHSYPSDIAPRKVLDEKYWQDSSRESSKEEAQYARNALLPLDDDHANCKRQILYCCDRLCVINEKNVPQQLYKFHRRKVSALALHPNRQLICSCEVSSTFAQLHLWRQQERTTIITLTSKHRAIITRAQFSRDGQWIVTLGGSERAQSIQIFNWENQETVAFRFVQDQSINEVLFNPYQKRQLCFAGLGLIRIYRVEEELIIKEQCRVPEQKFQAIVYTSNIYGSDIESDVITGSAQGDIGLYVCGSFLYSQKKAHDKGITCLRLAELFQYKRVLISGGGDGYVRIWDIKFNEISRKNVRQELYSIKNTSQEMPEAIVVNVDIYQCMKKQGQSSGSALMLIATSDGSVLEATITNEFQGYKAVSLVTAESQPLKEKINFDISLSFAAPPSHNDFRSLVCRNMLITHSRKSRFVYFWNMNFRSREKIFPLAGPALLVSKMNTRTVLLIGSQEPSGNTLKLYQLGWSAGVYLRDVSLCGQIQLQKGSFIPMDAQFSPLDNKVAVRVKIQDIEQVWLYESTESSDGMKYGIRLRIQQKSPLLLTRAEWCLFSSRQDGLMVAWSEYKADFYGDGLVRYKSYACNNRNSLDLGGFSFDAFDFSAKVRASYIPCFQLAGQNSKEYSPKDTITVTRMVQHGRYLLMGTASGEILTVESSFFARKQGDSKYYARYHVVGDSPITMLQVHEGELIASCESGEAVFVASLQTENILSSKEVCKDPFSESIGPQELEKRIKETYQKRKKIENEGELVGGSCSIDLRLSAVIGRNAFFKRNNIFIDLKDNIISFSGCNLLSMRHQPGKRLHQRIIKPDNSSNSNHPEISCMVLGDCKRFLLIGTSEENAKIIAWDISTNTSLFDIKLNGFIMVNLVKLSFSNKHSAVLATAKNGHQYLLFMDLINKVVLAVHHFHKNTQINDLCFVLGQQFRVQACGVRYMAEWSYCNNLLTEKMFSFTSGEEKEDIKAQAIVFYSLIFIDEYAICSGSDGYLYVWKDEKVVKRQNAHPKEPILCLYTSNSKIFVSGANNGTVITWRFSSSLIIQKDQEYSIYPGKEAKVPVKYQVQSICMTKDLIIVGNRAGEIMGFSYSNDPEITNEKPEDKSKAPQNKIPVTVPILSGFNHEVIRSCAFNPSSKKLYVMTEAEGFVGTFSVFDLETLQKIKQEKMELKSSLIRMLVCQKSHRIFIVLRGSILTYTYQAEVKDDKFNKLQKSKNWLKCQPEIKTAVLNKSQTFLAVLVASNQIQNARIEIYNLSVQEGQFFALYRMEESPQASIDVIDFCTDHDYLVCQGTDEEQTIIDLMTKEKIKTGTLQNPPMWNEEAKRTAPNIKEITTYYSQENKLLRVVQVKNEAIIATDEMGSVRVFPYPLAANRNYKVHIEHLNHIYLCVLSHDDSTLVTVSRQDRAIHLWEVIQNTQKQTQ